MPIEGYYIGFRANSESIFAYKTHSLLNLVPRDVEEFVIQGLNKRTKYCVICQAYNEQGNGPSSKEVCASTFEYGEWFSRFEYLAPQTQRLLIPDAITAASIQNDNRLGGSEWFLCRSGNLSG